MESGNGELASLSAENISAKALKINEDPPHFHTFLYVELC